MRATAALFTLVALLAAAPAAASVERDTFVLPVDTLLPCGVGGETIHLTGTASYHVLSVADPAGGFRLLIGAKEFLSGTGLTTGDAYRRVGSFQDVTVTAAGGITVLSTVTHAQLIGRNGNQVTFARTLVILLDGNVIQDIQVSSSCA